MTFLNQESGFCFLHIPKNAGTSIKSYLYQHFRNDLLLPKSYRLLFSSLPFAITCKKRGLTKLSHINYLNRGHVTYNEVTSMIPSANMTFIAVIRDPYEYTKSMYKYIKQRPRHYYHDAVRCMSFSTYVEFSCENKLNSQSYYVVDRQNELPSNVKLVNIKEIETKLPQLLGFSGNNPGINYISKLNQTKPENLGDESGLQEAVKQAYPLDYKLYTLK